MSASIRDRGPSAAPTSATVTGAEQRAYALTPRQTEAIRLLDEAAAAVEKHLADGNGTGPEYDAKCKTWRERHAEWRHAMRAEVKA